MAHLTGHGRRVCWCGVGYARIRAGGGCTENSRDGVPATSFFIFTFMCNACLVTIAVNLLNSSELASARLRLVCRAAGNDLSRVGVLRVERVCDSQADVRQQQI